MDAYDVIIVGTGAGGGTLARHLAPSGKRILLLERGDWLPREPENWLAQDVFVDNRYVSPDTWYDANGKAVPAAGALLRRRRDEALRRSALPPAARRTSASSSHHDGISPAWPISYDELEPYYTLAEQMYEVHGARGEDPTEPPASAPYPFPAVSHEPRIQQLADDLAAAGYHPFHAPVRHHVSTRRTCRTARASAARTATASRASSTRSRTPRCSAFGRRSSTRTSRC